MCVCVSGVSSHLDQSLSAARQLTSDQNSTQGLANPQYKGVQQLLPALRSGWSGLGLGLALCVLTGDARAAQTGRICGTP